MRIFPRVPGARLALLLAILFLSTAGAQLVREANNTLKLSESNPPALLSQTGAFSNLATLTPQPGIVPFAPNVSFWSDYAQKTRWFCIPNLTGTITFDRDGNWTFPNGMVWVKHFELPLERTAPNGARRRIETRFLVKTPTGAYGLTYKWREDQSDADLVGEFGENQFIQITVNGQAAKQLWSYPSRADCNWCHGAGAGTALGFNTRQMNGPHVYGSQNLNQIAALSGAGYFSSPVSHVNNLPALAKATDTTQSLEWRVRSYFAANCSQCHQPASIVGPMWDARPTTPTDSAHIINGELSYDWKDPKNRFIVPGDTGHSVALQRIAGVLPRMPPLATSEIDPAAVQLLQEWIEQELPARRSFAQFQVHYFGSEKDPEAAPQADPDGDGHTNMEEYLAYTDPWQPASAPEPTRGTLTPTEVSFSFTQPRNRAAVVETSTDMTNWTLWDVPGNAPDYPATSVLRTLSVPRQGEARRFFQVRLSAP